MRRCGAASHPSKGVMKATAAAAKDVNQPEFLEDIDKSIDSAYHSTHRRVLALAIPKAAANIIVPLQSALETAVLGRVGQTHLAAIGVATTIFTTVYGLCGFLRMGSSGLVAQAHGRGDIRAVLLCFLRPLLLSQILGACLVFMFPFYLPMAISWLNVEATSGTASLIADYSYARVLGAPAALLTYATTAYLMGTQCFTELFFLRVTQGVANVVMLYVFIAQFGPTPQSVGMARTITEWMSALSTLAVILWHFRSVYSKSRNNWSFPSLLSSALSDLKHVQNWQDLIVSRDVFVRTALLLVTYNLMQRAGAQLGDESLAVNAVLMQWQHFIAYGLDGFADVAEALAGSAFGARDRSMFGVALRTSSLWAALAALSYSSVYAIASTSIVACFTNIDSIQAQAHSYRLWLVLSPVVSVGAFQMDGVFLGVAAAHELRNAVATALVGYIFVVFILPASNHALWGAFMAWLAIRGVYLLSRLPAIYATLSDERS
eukprot:TRINITY_DN74660_c0_g1_i1.p1 TRINITY_DN74660_c0_g1~~TRINITY_DN74660_c0_g1_i1.p1  ORF type:complete len:490 (-),score=27.12 TRINITY_DN74660_c0_g1_i1:182-1651(-)